MKPLAVVLAVMSGAFAQTVPQAFGLRGDLLGETLQDFRARNAKDVIASVVAHGQFRLHYPVCSGEPIPGQYGIDLNFATSVLDRDDPPNKSRYQVCVTGQVIPGSQEGPAPTIAGVEARNLLYRFFDGKLFEISAMIGPEDFATLSMAFRDKYGEPAASQIEKFQNGFGATFQGVSQQWRTGDSVIDLHEIDPSSKYQVSTVGIFNIPAFSAYHRIRPRPADPVKDL